MNRPRLIRGLCIAVSMACALLCGLLLALWVRSYYRFDWWGPGITLVDAGQVLHPKAGFVCESARGTVSIWYAGNLRDCAWWAWTVGSTSPESHLRVTGDDGESAFDGFRATTYSNRTFRGSVPIWCMATLCGVFAAFAWFRPGFSLRALLIATTLIAVVLGSIVCSR